MKKQNLNLTRYLLYLIGIVVLALGLTLNTKTGLGTSPIISVSYAIASKFNLNLGNTTLIQYCTLVFIEIIIHIISKEKYKTIITDILQIPFSIVFTRFMNIFVVYIPECKQYSLLVRLLVLFVAIIFTGIGAALTLNVKLIPNPGDGIVKTIASFISKETGLVKNIFDFSCIALTILFCLFSKSPIYGIGIGTILAMLLTGRVMTIFNKITINYFNGLLK